MKRTAFTMIELVFVIVILGILAAVAIPKFAATRDDAQITKGRSDVAAIRSAIVSERQARLLQGSSTYISALDQGVASATAGVVIFDDSDAVTTNGTLLQYGITTAAGNGHWMKTGAGAYTYQVMNDPVAFTYTQATGAFDCTHTNANCRLLTE
ncbi:MAG: ral secretion pathway protein [Campylobacterota bacterium]|nr:ral secretion pathway protein [Campylobacterota bacterium]